MNLKINFLLFFLLSFTLNIALSNQSKNSFKESNNRRNLQNSEFQPIRILMETSIIDQYSNIISNEEEIYWACGNSSLILSKLISVKRVTKDNPIKYDFSEYKKANISKDIVNKTLIEGNSNYDLIIIVDLNDEKTYMETLCRDKDNKRTTLGFLNFDFVEIYNKNAINLQYLFIHYIIHFLGFSFENFEYFTKNGNKIEVYEMELDARMNLNTYYIKTPKVLEIARKYYNCSNITKFPLENQEGNINAHWDARLLLGDIMNSYNNASDHVISEFTLALLEDSGWYQVNYYTGGLMQFGKNKGCDFIYNDCTIKFKNEFCEYFTSDPFNVYIKNGSCSSGRQSRTYCSSNDYIYNYALVPEFYRRYPNKGVQYADYCMINEAFREERGTNLIIGSCRYALNDDPYGSRLDLKGNNRKGISSAFFESFSNQSYCVLISLIPNFSNEISNRNDLLDIIHPMCYQMFCSDKTLTIKIKEQYIACPRQGGKVKIGGEFQGYLYCPDYYLICSGTVLCNDMFDCIKKESLTKEESFFYDYISITSQIQTELRNDPILRGYEISNNGICKINCAQCYKNGTCFECRENYFFVGDYLGQKIEEIKCLEIEVDKGYYFFESVYYPCLSNCNKCTNGTLCQQCTSGFYFIGNDRTYCDNTKNLSKYFSEDGGISYFPCDTYFEKCETCESRNICKKCQTDYYFIGETKLTCEPLPDKTNYFTEDGGISYLLCSNYIQNCQSCNSRNYCTQCHQGYYMVGDDRNHCLNNFITNFNEYYLEDALGPVYYPCDTHFNHCLTCTDKNTCTNCKNNFIFLRGEKKECFILEPNKTYIDIDGFHHPCYDAFPSCEKCSGKGSCSKCFDGYYFTYDENKNLICDMIDISKYYKNEKDIYILCSDAIKNCEQCQSGTKCNECQKDFYFLKNDFNNCRNDLDLRKYYSEDDNKSFYPCDEAMNQCNFCNNKTVCEQCYDNYYLYRNNLNDCIELGNIERYYKKGISYYPCDEIIVNCEKCSDEETCYECRNNLKIVLDRQNHCFEEKLNVVSEIIRGKGLKTICRDRHLDRHMVEGWLVRYRLHGKDGLLKKASRSRISPSEKESIILEHIQKGVSLSQLSLRYDIGRSTIKSWLRRYRSGGSLLHHDLRHQMARAKKKEKQTELERLQAENLRLRAENALLKKVRALVEEQEARARLNGQEPSTN